MLKVLVKSENVEVRSGVTKEGKPYTIRNQDAWVFLTDSSGVEEPYPTKMRLSLGDLVAYKPGEYIMAGSCFEAGPHGRLVFNDRRVSLIPKAAAPRAVA